MSNTELVEHFYAEVFNGHNLDAIDRYVKEDYIQHNPNVADGREGFKAFAEKFFSLKPHMDIRFLSEDKEKNLVYVFFKCSLTDGSVNKVVDIYRIEDDLLAEHWDVVEHHLEKLQPLHSNGLF